MNSSEGMEREIVEFLFSPERFNKKDLEQSTIRQLVVGVEIAAVLIGIFSTLLVIKSLAQHPGLVYNL